jgi:hypothetical protein
LAELLGQAANASVRELVIARKGTNNADRMLVAATYGRGVWRTRLWDGPSVAVKHPARNPGLQAFSASPSGSWLNLRFRLEGTAHGAGTATVELRTVDGKAVWREEVPGVGAFKRRIDIVRPGKGLYLFLITNGTGRVSRRVMVP